MNERLAADRRTGDEGFTLIEVMVALLVFAILSTGIVAGSSTVIRMTTDNRARITAANLASQDLDLVRAIADPFSIPNITAAAPERIPMDGNTFVLTRSVSWISADGTDVSCNSSANLFFLRVNVRVTWDGMLGTTAAVEDDTILAPSDGTTDSETGAIGIQVEGASAQPISGVTVTVSVPSGSTGVLPPTQPKATTAEGCTYVNDLKPGLYRVTITKGGYRGDGSAATTPTQGATIYQDLTVSAGSTNSYTFHYDQAATYATSYVAGPVSAGGSPRLPSNLPVSFLSNSTVYTTTAAAGSIGLFPYSTGYSVIAGPLGSGSATCSSVDPQAWVASTVNGVALAAGQRAADAKSAGQTGTLAVPLGVVNVKAAAGSTLTATQALPQGAGNPGCTVTGTVLRWTATASGGWDRLELPYGSWTILADGSAVGYSDLQVLTNAAQPGVALDGTVTLDPRKAR